MKFRSFSLLFSASILIVSCVSTGPSFPGNAHGTEAAGRTEAGTAERQEASPATEAPGTDPVRDMKTFLADAEAAVASGEFSEGIRNYISVLAAAESASPGNSEARALADQARAHLEKMGNALSLQPQSHWIDSSGIQKEGSCQNAGKDASMNPGVILSFTSGGGKYVIPDAPIRFSFVKGRGKIVESVTTDEYGLANSSILSFDSKSTGAVIRATVEYTVPGFTWTFSGIFRDFVYLPQSRTATIIAAEKSELGLSPNPLVLDDTYLALKNLRMDYSPWNAALLVPEFDSLYNGDQPAIERAAIEAKVSYLVVVLVDCFDVRQVVVGDKAYNMYASFATVNLRIIRAGDKRIVYSLPVERIRGQGSTKETAVQDVFRKARAEYSSRLRGSLDEIEKAMAGES